MTITVTSNLTPDIAGSLDCNSSREKIYLGLVFQKERNLSLHLCALSFLFELSKDIRRMHGLGKEEVVTQNCCVGVPRSIHFIGHLELPK